jgi:RNA polymerase sporulation-specific sigma factor
MKINKVEICGVYSSELPVLKEKEMKELLFRLQHGDFKCRETFIKGNKRLILSVIHCFDNRGENMDDLFQVGCIGLMKSIDNFDVSLNVSFSTYAVPMIIGEVRKYLKDNNSCRISMSLKDLAYRALQVRDRLVSVDNKEPTISQIAKELNLPCEEVIFALDTLQDGEPIYNDDREKQILNLRFAYGRTQMEVANEIGLSMEQVSRLEKTALKHMRKYV